MEVIHENALYPDPIAMNYNIKILFVALSHFSLKWHERFPAFVGRERHKVLRAVHVPRPRLVVGLCGWAFAVSVVLRGRAQVPVHLRLFQLAGLRGLGPAGQTAAALRPREPCPCSAGRRLVFGGSAVVGAHWSRGGLCRRRPRSPAVAGEACPGQRST